MDPLSDPEAQRNSQHDPELKKRYWFLGTKTYVTGALERCTDIMQLKPIYKGVRVFSPVEQIKKQSTPIVIKNGNHPATDDGELCNAIQHRTYQQLLGIALWIALCGRYDICYAMNVLSAFSAAPKRKHLERVYHLIGYLRKHPERWIMIDSSEPGCVEGEEQYPEAKQREMHEIYPDVVEEIDPRAPKPKGKEIKTACFFDAAMGSEMTRGRGHTGITLFVGRTPVSCISMRQGTAEASSYGSEFIAGRVSVEEVLALRGALRALGVPVNSPTKWYGDNLSILQSSNIPEATLKKRHVNIAYHMCREQVAANVLTPIKVRTGDNVADTATKALDGSALEHINNVLFAKPFLTDHEVNLRRMRIWYETISKA
jgi:hypothetical protein